MTAALVGRESERQILRTRVEDLRQRIGGIAIIAGLAGLGKTTLLDDLVANVPAEITVLRAAADPFEHDRPLGLLLDALTSSDHTRRHAAALRSALGAITSVPTASRHQAVDAAVAILDSAPAEVPLLLALDDVQWADPVTVMTLSRLARRRPLPAILVVLAMRPPRHSAETARFLDVARAGGADLLSLELLTAEQVMEVAEISTGTRPAPELAQALEGAGGNPFLVTELLDAWRREGFGAPITGKDGTRLTGTGMPASYAQRIVRLLAASGPPVIRLAESLAVAGGRSSPREIASVLGVAQASVVAMAQPAIDAGLLVQVGHTLAFRHDLVREAVYETMPYLARLAAHAKIMQALAAGGAAPSLIAPHASVVAAHGDQSASLAAVGWLRTAARDALPAAPDVAVRHLQTAVASVTDAEIRCDLQADLAEALACAGRVVEAKALADRLDGVADTEVLARARRIGAFSLRMLGRFDAARAILLPLAAQAGDKDAASLTAELALAALLVGDLDQALDRAAAAMRMADATRDRLAAALAQAVETRRAWRDGQFTVATDSLAAAIARGLAEPDVQAAMLPPVLQLGLDLICLDRTDEAERLRREIVGRAASGSSPWWGYVGHLISVWYYDATGQWDEALVEAEAGLDLAADHDYGYGQLVLRAVAARICVLRGAADDARHWLEPAQRQVTVAGPNFSAPLVRWAQGTLQLSAADAAGAVVTLARAEAELVGSPWWTRQPFLAADLAEAAVSCGKTASVAEALRRATDIADRIGAPSARIHAALAHALTDADTVRSCIRLCRGPGAPAVPAALAQARLGAELARRGRSHDARDLFTAALPALAQVRASPLLAQAEACLRPSELRGPAMAFLAAGWAAVTPAERGVAELVAAGLTNPEIARHLFISRNTVQTHLRHIYAKLGLRSRTELTAAILRERATRHASAQPDVRKSGQPWY